MPGPAATIGSNHVCPMCTGWYPHIGGPVTGPGVPTVLIGGKPAAVMGDMCVCIGPPDTIAQGCATVLIGGKPASTIGDMTAHGGSIVVGEPTVLIGTGGSSPTAVMPIAEIPFPKHNFVNRIKALVVGEGENLDEALENQEQLREASQNNDGEPRIYNLKWVKEEQNIRDSREFKQVTLVASVSGIEDGEVVTFNIKKNIDIEGVKFDEYKELSGKVEGGKVEVNWDVEVPNN